MDVFVEDFEVADLLARGAVGDRTAGGQERQHARGAIARQISGAMHSDQTKVRQSLFNLLSNAAKFTKQGTDHAGGAAARPRQAPTGWRSRSRTPGSA